ncbi:hypothetical protein BT96DRAFT_926399 [Gymnopus androsaceus JB14]|uniref:Uncharacterized protein n=1 Tax=Gymnopus androsaceus JB14 TaxID=1447944 RepID=A0A6A4GV60_9AGAR|nr:hypothetical protein BT96DRAFT_926399 [Gymnopus androsaceus JB14]
MVAYYFTSKTQVEAILLLFIESGALFALIQLSNVIIDALDTIHGANDSIYNARLFLETIYIYSAAMNPGALVVLVHTGNTYEQSFHLEDGPLENDSTDVIS